MRPIVAARFLDFTRPLEGLVEHMYVDVKGLVTIGFGNLIDPIRLPAGSCPSSRRLERCSRHPGRDHRRVEPDQGRRQQAATQYQGIHGLRPLDHADADAGGDPGLVRPRLRGNETELKKVGSSRRSTSGRRMRSSPCTAWPGRWGRRSPRGANGRILRRLRHDGLHRRRGQLPDRRGRERRRGPAQPGRQETLPERLPRVDRRSGVVQPRRLYYPRSSCMNSPIIIGMTPANGNIL